MPIALSIDKSAEARGFHIMVGIFCTGKHQSSRARDLHDFVFDRECKNEDDTRRRITTFLLHAGQTHGMFFGASFPFFILSEFRYYYLALSLISVVLLLLRFADVIGKTSATPVAIMGVGEMVLYCKIFVVIFLNYEAITAGLEAGYGFVAILILLIALQMIWREFTIWKIFNWARMIPKGRRQ